MISKFGNSHHDDMNKYIKNMEYNYKIFLTNLTLY